MSATDGANCPHCGAILEADCSSDLCPRCTISQMSNGFHDSTPASVHRIGRMARKLLLASIFPLIGAITIVGIGWLRDQLGNHLPDAAQASYDRASALLDQGKPRLTLSTPRSGIKSVPTRQRGNEE